MLFMHLARLATRPRAVYAVYAISSLDAVVEALVEEEEEEGGGGGGAGGGGASSSFCRRHP